MLRIDFDKAFDRVKRDVLLDFLERTNVVAVISEGVKMVYKECTTRLIVDKKLTEAINE